MTLDYSDAPLEVPCINHPRRLTAVRCGKCDNPICTRCMIQTPVGMRCRTCANLRRLPQFDVGWQELARAIPAGLIVAALAWIFISTVPFLRFFMSVIVGLAVGEAMSHLARRRSNLLLEIGAVAAVVAGYFVALAVRSPDTLSVLFRYGDKNSALQLSIAFPLFIASFVAVVKLR